MKDTELESAIRVGPVEWVVDFPVGGKVTNVTLPSRLRTRLVSEGKAKLPYETGGLLIGKVQWKELLGYVEVTGYARADGAKERPLHVTFTHESWENMQRQREIEYPDAVVVGWYHTHPGIGVFLSDVDREMHVHIFGEQPWCVALVLDPVRNQSAFFWLGPAGFERCTMLNPKANH